MSRVLILISLVCISFLGNAQSDVQTYLKNFNLNTTLKKHLKFSTVYGAVNGGTSVSDVKTFSCVAFQIESAKTFNKTSESELVLICLRSSLNISS